MFGLYPSDQNMVHTWFALMGCTIKPMFAFQGVCDAMYVFLGFCYTISLCRGCFIVM